jgi:hypothetical protein
MRHSGINDKCVCSSSQKASRKEIKRSRFMWVDSIKFDSREVGLRVWTGLDELRIGSTGRLVNIVINLQVS